MAEIEYHLEECTRKNLCIDCDNVRCWFQGKLISDCPKYRCDRPIEQFEDCDTCAFIKRFVKDMRKIYAEEVQS